MDYQATGSPPFINVGLSLDEWKAYVATYNFGSIPPSRVVLHHTWRPTVAEWRGLASMKGMQTYYRGLGWSAAPHIYVGPDKIWLATPMREVGIHAGTGNSGNWNSGKWSYSIGLEMVGNYDAARPSGAVWDYARAVMGELSKRLGIAPRQLIYFHRDFSTKSCPGWAVTKDWVFGEVESYVNNTKPPTNVPVGQVGTPTPDVELVMETLLNESFAKRAEGFTSEWAFHQYAIKNDMGVPLARSARVSVGGKEYNYQPFARDTLYCEIPKWGEVKLLSDLLGGSIPPAGNLGRVLLEATYKACGATFHADWAFHQYALSAKLGPPIGGSSKIRVGGAEYAYQVFAVDTLYNRVPNWSDVKQLSRLSNASSGGDVALREALLAIAYKSGGATYHADWAFHQMARKLDNGNGIGVPLAESQKVVVGSTTYAIQVYTLDTLYNVVPNWSDVKRLSDLVNPAPVSFAVPGFLEAEAEEEAPPEGRWEPPVVAPYEVLRYSPPSPSFSDRAGAPVSLVVIHGDTGLASATLERMTSFGARMSVHYYITVDGTIYQLVDEQDAAWHSGMVTLGGLWFNTNRISIGVMLEGMPELMESSSSNPASPEKRDNAQVNALHWLLRDLVRRYRLQPDDVVLSNSLCTNPDTIPEELLMLRDMFSQ